MFSFSTFIEYFKYNKALEQGISLLEKNLKSKDSFCFTSTQLKKLQSDFRLVHNDIKKNKKLYNKLYRKLERLTFLINKLEFII